MSFLSSSSASAAAAGLIASPPQTAAVHPLLALRRGGLVPPAQQQQENVFPGGHGEGGGDDKKKEMKQKHQQQQQQIAAEAMAKKRKHHQLAVLQQQKQQQQQQHQQQQQNKLSDDDAFAAACEKQQQKRRNNNDCHPLLRQDDDYYDEEEEQEEPGPIVLTAYNHYGHGHRAEYEEYNDDDDDDDDDDNDKREASYSTKTKKKVGSSSYGNGTAPSISVGNRSIPPEKKQFVEEICWRELHENGVAGLRNLTAGTVWDEHSHFFGKGGYKYPSFSALYNRTRTAVIMQHTGQNSVHHRGCGGPERKKKKTSASTAAVVRRASSYVSSSSNERIPSEKKRIVEMECKKVLESEGTDGLRQMNPADIWDAHYDILSQGGYGFDAFRMLVRRVRMHLLGEKEERRSGSVSGTRRKSSTTSRGQTTTTSTTTKTMTSSNSSRSIPEEKKRLVEAVCRNELANGVDSLKRLLPATVWDDHYELLSQGGYGFSAFKAYYTRARAAVIEDHLKRTNNRSKSSSTSSLSSSNSSRAIPLEKKRLVFDVCTTELNTNGVDGLRRLLPAVVWEEHYELLSKGNYEFSAFKAYYTRARASIIEDHLKATETAGSSSSSSATARQLRHHNHHEEHPQPPKQQQEEQLQMIDSLQKQVQDLTETVQLHSADMDVTKTNQKQLELAIAGVILQQQKQRQQQDGAQQSTGTESTASTSTATTTTGTNSTNSDKKFCIFCGTNLPIQAAFCCSCGNKQCSFPSSGPSPSSSEASSAADGAE